MSTLRGVIAAITTPFTDSGEPDLDRFIARARTLLAGGCDGLNVLGSTGEATSLSVEQRVSVMRAAGSSLPLSRLMVGTGAAAVRDACTLTREAAEIGFAGALLLPPFYYKSVSEDGILRFVDAVVQATTTCAISLYLYNFPALSGIAYTPDLVTLLRRRFGDRVVGLKDSSGDLAYAREVAAISPALAVFPSSETTLMAAREDGPFAGCISATANVTAKDCALAYRNGDETALARAASIRAIFNGIPLVPAIKALVALHEKDAAHARTLPPLMTLKEEECRGLLARYLQACLK